MATAAPHITRPPSRMTGTQWIFLTLLVISVCINYIDRGSLGIAGPRLALELKLSPLEFGKLLSAFFWTYAPMQIVSGWLVDRFNVNRVYAAGFFIWSIATLITGSITTAFALLLLRLTLGIGESVAYPAYSKIISAHFPEHHRGVANGLIDAGSKLGPALGVFLGGLFMAQLGWRAFFWAMGLASMVWLIPWFIWAPKDEIAEVRDQLPAPSIVTILGIRAAWGNYLGLFCANYVWYFIVLWLPSYFVNERHYTASQMAFRGSLPYWSVAIAASLAGWLADRVISRGGQPVRVRKAFIAGGLLLSTLILPAAMVKDQNLSLILLSLGCFAFGGFSANHWALAQTLSGPLASGKWTGLANAIGNIPGIIGPWFTGWVIQRTGEYYYAFVVCVVMAVLGAISYVFVINRNQTIDWSKFD